MTAILDIDLLRTFHAVVRIGKFSAAAEHLHKSAAAVSVHIQRLEAVAGGRLLNRDNQSVSLTVLGKRLLLSTTELLRTHDHVQRRLAERGPGAADWPEFRIARQGPAGQIASGCRRAAQGNAGG